MSTDMEEAKRAKARAHFEWQERVCARTDISSRFKIVAWALALFRNTQTGQCDPSYDSIAKQAAVSRSTAIRAVAEFERLHLIEVDRSRGRNSNRFVFVISAANGVRAMTPLEAGATVSNSTPTVSNRASNGVKSGQKAVQRCHSSDTQTRREHEGETRNTPARAAPTSESTKKIPMQGRRRKVASSPKVPSVSASESSDVKAAAAEAFAKFWNVYPKQISKLDAEQAFANALAGASAEVIIAGARRYAADPTRRSRGERYTKNPGNWLRAGCWADGGTGNVIDEHGNPVDVPQHRGNGHADEPLLEGLTPNMTWEEWGRR